LQKAGQKKSSQRLHLYLIRCKQRVAVEIRTENFKKATKTQKTTCGGGRNGGDDESRITSKTAKNYSLLVTIHTLLLNNRPQ
jgi:hypothetical protein